MIVLPFFSINKCLRKHVEIEALLLQFQVRDMGLKNLGIQHNPRYALYAAPPSMFQLGGLV
jgi:hypothetical protein